MYSTENIVNYIKWQLYLLWWPFFVVVFFKDILFIYLMERAHKQGEQQTNGEGEEGSPWSSDPNEGLNPRTLISWPELKADTHLTEPPRRPYFNKVIHAHSLKNQRVLPGWSGKIAGSWPSPGFPLLTFSCSLFWPAPKSHAWTTMSSLVQLEVLSLTSHCGRLESGSLSSPYHVHTHTCTGLVLWWSRGSLVILVCSILSVYTISTI